MILNAGSVLNIPVQTSDIWNIYRVPSKSTSANMPVIVEFTTTIMKENFLQSVKNYNRKNSRNKLNSLHLKIEGPELPIYISENLTSNGRRLYSAARKFASEQKFDFCWTSNGRVYLRKKEGDPLRRIEFESDLEKIKCII